MTTNKSESLIKSIGSSLAESVGIRAKESTLPKYSANAEAPRTDFVRNRSVGDIHPTEIIPDPEQPRKHFDEDELDRLAADIQQRGQLQPIRVRWSGEHKKWVIIAGERRWRAITKAGLSKISCIFIDREMSVNEIKSEQLVENLLRQDLAPIEEAHSFRELMKLNSWNASALAKNLNISNGKISKALALLKLPEDLQRRIATGELTPSAAYELSKVKDQSQQLELANNAGLEGTTREEMVAKITKKRDGGTKAKPRSTNETFRTADGVRITVTARRHLDHATIIQNLIEVAELVRQRGKGSKAA